MVSTQRADTAAAVSITGWIVSKALDWQPVLQDLAFIATIVAGLAAGLFHLTKLYIMWTHRKKG